MHRIDYVGLLDLDTHEALGLMRLVWGSTSDKKDALDSQFLNPVTGLWVQSGEVLAELYDAGAGASLVSSEQASQIARLLGGTLSYPGDRRELRT